MADGLFFELGANVLQLSIRPRPVLAENHKSERTRRHSRSRRSERRHGWMKK